MISMKQILKTVFWVAALVALMFVAVFFFEIYKNEHNSHIERLTYSKMTDDYDMLWKLVYDEAPFIPAAMAENGVDADKLITETRRKLNYLTPPEDFVELIFSMEQSTRQMGHFRSMRELDIIENPLGMELFSLKNYRIELDMFNLKSAEFLAWLPEEDAFSNREPLPVQTPPETQNKKIPFGDFSFGQIIDDSTAYVSFSSFTDGALDDAALNGLMDFYKDANACENLIIDIRNATGEYGTGWLSWIVEPLANRELDYRTVSTYSNGEYVSKFYKNAAWVAENATADLSIAAERPELQNTLSIWGDTGYYLLIGDYTYQNTSPDTAYNGKIWVLTNEITLSAADTFANFCKYSGFASLVGAPTGGNGIWYDPENILMCGIQLPNSGFMFSFSPCMGINLDGTSNIVRGDLPDYPTDGDALEYCLTLVSD